MGYDFSEQLAERIEKRYWPVGFGDRVIGLLRLRDNNARGFFEP